MNEKKLGLYEILLTEEQSEKLTRCGDKSLEASADYGLVAKDFTFYVNRVELMFMLEFLDDFIHITTASEVN